MGIQAEFRGLGRLTTAGAVTEFRASITGGSGADEIAVGPDGHPRFAEFLDDQPPDVFP
jgi:hypothetical protein